MVRRLAGLWVALVALVALATLDGVFRWPGRPVSLASLDSSPSQTLQRVYLEDERRGNQILQAMRGKVRSPLLDKLLKSKKMRGVLAAAIGSAREQENVNGGGLAFDLGNIISGEQAGKHLAVAPHHLQQMRQQGHRMQHATAAKKFAPAVAASRPAVAAPKPSVPAKQVHAASAPALEYNEFAPGVLPGTGNYIAPKPAPKPARPPAKPAKKLSAAEVAAAKAAAAQRAKLLHGVETATGFADKTVAADTHEAKLQAKIKALEAAGAAQQAQLGAELAAARAKAASLAARAKRKAQQLAAVKAKALKARDASPAAKAARAKAHAAEQARAEEKAEAAAKEAQRAKIAKLVAEEMSDLASQSDIINEPVHRRAVGAPLGAAEDATSPSTVQQATKETRGVAAAEAGPLPVAAGQSGGAQPAAHTLQGLRGQDWHDLAKQSKALARDAARHGAVQAHAARVAAETAPAAGTAGTAPAKAKQWVTTVRKGPLPYLCGVPLVEDVAEDRGVDCRRVHHQRVAGGNKILSDIEAVGLGDETLPLARQAQPEFPAGRRAAVHALGYKDAAQYERHTLLQTIAHQQDEIDAYKRRAADKTGGLVTAADRAAAAAAAARAHELAAVHRALGADAARRTSALRPGGAGGASLRGLALDRALHDDVGHLGDDAVPLAEARGGVDLGGATVQ